MQDETFSYEGFLITISPQVRKGRLQWWFIVNARPIQFVSRPDTAKRLACQFIDTVLAAYHKKSRTHRLSKR
jgi:hypothetical protein